MINKTTKPLYAVVFVGLMAAMIFVATYFLGFTIPTPAGPTMIKTANILCLLGGMLFGGLYGGLAAGIGSMLFDLLNPLYVAYAPFTLVFFFLMAFVCGLISNSGGAKGVSFKRNIVAGVCGAVTYYVLNIGRSIVTLMLAGSAFGPAVAANGIKFITSGINAVIAVIFAVILAPILKKALIRANILAKD